MARAGGIKVARDCAEALHTINTSIDAPLDSKNKDKVKQQIAAFYDHVANTRVDTWNWGLIDSETHEYIAARIPGYQQHGRDGFSEQLYCYVLRQVLRKRKLSGKILEVGCGSGMGLNFLSRLEPTLVFVGVDLSASSIALANAQLARNAQLTFCEGDAEHLPFENNEFDAVLNIESAHNYPDLGLFLNEVARVLKPGGLISLVDVFTKSRLTLFEQCLQRTTGLALLNRTDVTSQVRDAIVARMQPNSVFRRVQRQAAPFGLRALNERGQMLTHGAVLLENFDWDLLTRLLLSLGRLSAGPAAPSDRYESYHHFLLAKQP